MLKSLLSVLLCFTVFTSSAQQRYRDRSANMSCPKFYVGISTGLENQSGLIGPNFDVPITNWFSFGFGAGRSSWGYKGYSETRFYFGDCNRQFALGMGATYNTGISNFVTPMPTVEEGTADVRFELKPSLNAFLSAYYFFSIGQSKSHRFYLQSGYSHPLFDDVYTVKSKNITLTREGETAMQILRPGGVIFALGFSFGFGGER